MKNLKATSIFAKSNKKGGISILGVVLLTIVLIFVLSFFKINLKAVVESPDAQNNLQYVGYTGRSLWNDYLAKPIANVVGDLKLKTVWDAFISNMQRIHDGQPTDFQKLAPTVDVK